MICVHGVVSVQATRIIVFLFTPIISPTDNIWNSFQSEVYRYSEFKGVIIGWSEFSFDPFFGMLIIECCCWLLLNSYRGNCPQWPIVVLVLGSDFHLSLFLRNEQGFVTKRKGGVCDHFPCIFDALAASTIWIPRFLSQMVDFRFCR